MKRGDVLPGEEGADFLSYHREVLLETPHCTVIRIIWGPGQKTRPHDHNLFGIIHVVRGKVFENLYHKENFVLLKSHKIDAGGMFIECTEFIQVMGNDTGEIAETIHIFGGPLRMTYYDESKLVKESQKEIDNEGAGADSDDDW